MEPYKIKWDANVENLAVKVDKCEQLQKIKNFFNTNINVLNAKKFFNENMPLLATFISKCNNNQTPIVSINKKEFALSYTTRKWMVYSLTFLPLLFRKKKCIVKPYLLWSLLLCRENFNLRNYKFNYCYKYEQKKKKN